MRYQGEVLSDDESICEKCCKREFANDLGVAFCSMRHVSAFPCQNDELQLCLEQSDALIATTVMTSSVIMNDETPNEKHGLAREYYVNPTVSTLLYNSCPLRSVDMYCQMGIIVSLQTEK